MYGVYIYIYANIWGRLMGSMLAPYIAALWIRLAPSGWRQPCYSTAAKDS